MGNPLGPCLANAFLCHHEENWLNNCPPIFKPLLYRRYVDDIFLVFKSSQQVPLFLDYLNSKHPNIEFTSEIEQDGKKLPFLDLDVTKTENSFSTSVYRKPTFTGLMTRFDSSVPLQYKQNLVLSLVTRAYGLCSNYFNLHNELQYLRNLLRDNGFPTAFTNRYIGQQLNKIICPTKPISTVHRAPVYFTIPFIASKSFSVRNKVKRLVQEFYPQISLRVIFKPQSRLGNWFRVRDEIPCVLRSSVVYLYKCSSCNATYVGQTKRQLQTRISEHKGVSFRTNFPISKPSHSSIRTHRDNMDHPINTRDFSVLYTGADDMSRIAAESLFIKHLQPSLCAQEGSTPLICF